MSKTTGTKSIARLTSGVETISVQSPSCTLNGPIGSKRSNHDCICHAVCKLQGASIHSLHTDTVLLSTSENCGDDAAGRERIRLGKVLCCGHEKKFSLYS